MKIDFFLTDHAVGTKQSPMLKELEARVRGKAGSGATHTGRGENPLSRLGYGAIATIWSTWLKGNGRSAVPTNDEWSTVPRLRKEGYQYGVDRLRIWDDTSVQEVYSGDGTAEETSHHRAQAKRGEKGRIFLRHLVHQPKRDASKLTPIWQKAWMKGSLRNCELDWREKGVLRGSPFSDRG